MCLKYVKASKNVPRMLKLPETEKNLFEKWFHLAVYLSQPLEKWVKAFGKKIRRNKTWSIMEEAAMKGWKENFYDIGRNRCSDEIPYG